MTSIQIIGLENIDPLGKYGQKATSTIDRAVQRGSQILRDRAKTLPAVSSKTTGYDAKGIPVDTGRMRQSIQSRKLALLASGVAPHVKYGAAVHEGTSKMPARPFLDWALEAGAEKEIDEVVEHAVSQLFA